MFPTPNLSHLTAKDYEIVYEPAALEDTFLLLDALEIDADELRALRPAICLEIGSGSGCVSAFVGHILGPTALYLSTDVNAHACHCTRTTGLRNRVTIDCINASLANSLLYRLKNTVDVVLFNPPYVPTDLEEATTAQNTRGIDGAWAGGKDGMKITNAFLQVVKELLSPQGRFYLVALKANDVAGIRRKMLADYDLQSDVVLERRAGREHLFIIRFVQAQKLETILF